MDKLKISNKLFEKTNKMKEEEILLLLDKYWEILQNIKENKNYENIKETFAIKEQIDSLNVNINKLIEERDKLQYKVTKNEFLQLLDTELKNFENPEKCFTKLREGKINPEEFEKQFSLLGKGKNYYYYKLIYDRINND